jgi:hypothetical protein
VSKTELRARHKEAFFWTPDDVPYRPQLKWSRSIWTLKVNDLMYFVPNRIPALADPDTQIIFVTTFIV